MKPDLFSSKYFSKVLLFSIGFFGALVFVEAILQLTDLTDYTKTQRDPVSNLLIFKPNSHFTVASECFVVLNNVNSDGFHAAEFPKTKEPDVKRIVVIGGSFVEAHHVTINDMFTTVLENKLNGDTANNTRYEIIPVAYSNNGSYFSLLYYERFAKSLDPDAVIYFVPDITSGYQIMGVDFPPEFDSKNELIINFPESTESELKRKIKDIVRESKLIMNVRKRISFTKNYLKDVISEPNIFLKQPQITTADGKIPIIPETLWVEEEKVLKAMKKEITQDGADFMIAAWQVDGPLQKEIEARRASIAKKHDIRYFDMRSDMDTLEEKTQKQTDWSCDQHWSPTGHEYAAEALFNYIQSNDLF